MLQPSRLQAERKPPSPAKEINGDNATVFIAVFSRTIGSTRIKSSATEDQSGDGGLRVSST